MCKNSDIYENKRLDMSKSVCKTLENFSLYFTLNFWYFVFIF